MRLYPYIFETTYFDKKMVALLLYHKIEGQTLSGFDQHFEACPWWVYSGNTVAVGRKAMFDAAKKKQQNV